ncbi:4-hydroxy-tetrahydrodipicolinate reductase [Methanopyrus sp.]
MIGIVVLGATGRMGRRICRMVIEDEELELVGAIASPTSEHLGRDVGLLIGVGETGVEIAPPAALPNIAKDADVAIDFTVREATLENAPKAAHAGLDLVIGTTGFRGEDLRMLEHEIEEAGVSAVISANMSLGVNLLFELTRQLARVLGNNGFDFEIVEIHHRHKVDAPSGTALELAAVIEEELGKGKKVFGREGNVGPRDDDEIGVLAVRGGEVVGDHTVMALGEHERIELTHRALSRDAFAKGALVAAKFVVEAPPGVYSMRDVLFGGKREEGL